MNVYLYNNTKRLNSTAAAPVTYDTKDCVLKQGTSLINPVLIVNISGVPSYNYMKFEGRYYWITDIISSKNDLWELHGSIDVLSTYKGHIQATSAFVLYDSTANTQLPDSRLGIYSDCTSYTATGSMPWDFDSDAGTYLIATTGEKDYFDLDLGTYTPNQRNGTGVYAIPKTSIEQLGFDLNDFVTALLDIKNDLITDVNYWKNYLNPNNYSPADVITALQDTFYGMANVLIDITTEYPTRLALLAAQNLLGGGSALSNIKAAYWVPFVIPDNALAGTMHGTKLALGTYTDDVTGLKRVSKPVITAIKQSVNIPWHFNDWRDVSCTEIMLYIPLIGCINIPPEVVKGNATLEYTIALNIYSGEIAVEVFSGGAQIGTYGANTAMNILIGDSNINMGGAVNTVLAAVTKQYQGVATGAMETLAGMNTSVGGIGGGAGTGLTDKVVCICRCHETSQTPSALIGTIGTPTRQLKTLSGSGYCQCMNAQVNCATVIGEPNPTQTEIEMINNYLNNGIYLE